MQENYKGKVIVMVDDDPDMITTASDYLSEEGLQVKGFLDAVSFFTYLKDETPDLIVLDIVLPDLDGFQICRKLREEERLDTVPIIILSGQTASADKTHGLDLGADDYVIKPYSLPELFSRIKAALRTRAAMHKEEEEIKIGDAIIIYTKKHQVTVEGKKLELTPTELKIFKLLTSAPGQVFTREDIVGFLWGEEKTSAGRTIDVHITHLREKLGKYGDLIKMVRGVGYKFDLG
jgi:DNA-binding response OmpR family regulator